MPPVTAIGPPLESHLQQTLLLVVELLVVDLAGQVIDVRLDKGINNAKAFETCMLEKLKKLRFPASEKGIKTVIQVAFFLK